MSLEQILGEGEKRYPYHCEKNADRTKNYLGRCHARGILGKIHGLDGHIQHGKGIILTFLSLGVRFHRRDSKWLRANSVGQAERTLTQMGGHSVRDAPRAQVNCIYTIDRVGPCVLQLAANVPRASALPLVKVAQEKPLTRWPLSGNLHCPVPLSDYLHPSSILCPFLAFKLQYRAYCSGHWDTPVIIQIVAVQIWLQRGEIWKGTMRDISRIFRAVESKVNMEELNDASGTTDARVCIGDSFWPLVVLTRR